VAGRIDEGLHLDELVVQGNAAQVAWSVRGGMHVRAQVEAMRRLVLDARQALPGREVFFLGAALGEEREEVRLEVNIRSPHFSLEEMPELHLEPGEARLELGAYARGDFAAEEISWQVQAPPQVEVVVEGSRLRLAVKEEGFFEIVLTALPPSGPALRARLRLRVQGAAPLPEAESAGQETEDQPLESQISGTAHRSPETLLFDLPERVELEEGQTWEMQLGATGADSEELVWEAQAEGGEAVVEGKVLRLRAGQEDFQVRVRVRDQQENQAEQVLAVVVRPTDRRPPQLALSGRLKPDGQAEFRLVADEELDGLPVLLADGQVLAVEAGEGYFAAGYSGPGQGVVLVRAAGQDRAGNLGEAFLEVALGLIGNAEEPLFSADGRVRAQAGPGAAQVLLYREEEAYRVDFAPGKAVELVFAAPPGEEGTALLRSAGTGWEEVPSFASLETQTVYGLVHQPGLFRLGKGNPWALSPKALVVYPNPFNAATAIRYLVPRAGIVRLEVYNAQGQKVRTLVDKFQQAGPWIAAWDGRDQSGSPLASGAYLLRLYAGGPAQAGKAMVVR
jgi:hypothetical protein